MNIILASPRGFCAGVERAVDIVYKAMEIYSDKKIFVFHEIVHNKRVIQDFKDLGVTFTENIDDVPDKSVLIFSAHGVSDAVENIARSRDLIIIDASCPLVKKVHNEGKKMENHGYSIVIIGHENHPEIIGTMGRLKSDVFLVSDVSTVESLKIENNDIAYITQTTLSIDDTREIISALKKKFPQIKGPDIKDICYATQNRQNALKKLIELVQIIFVIGSENSSNCNSLCTIARSAGIPVYLIDHYSKIDKNCLIGINALGITSGASTPEILIEEILYFLQTNYQVCSISNVDVFKENVSFKLPKELM